MPNPTFPDQTGKSTAANRSSASKAGVHVEVLEAGEAQGQHGDEALAAGQRLGVAAELAEQADGVGGRLGGVVLERCRFHCDAPSMRSRMCDGVSGWTLTAVIPSGASASATALITAGGAPMAPPSPMP